MRLNAEHVRSWLWHLMKVVSKSIVPIAKERVCPGFGFGVFVGLWVFFPSFFWGFDWNLGLELVDRLRYCKRIKSMVQAGALKNVELHRFLFFQRCHLTFKISIKFPFNLTVKSNL